MPPLPILSGAETRAIFERLGWQFQRQSGSHMILFKERSPILSIPNHRQLAPGLLRGLIRRAGISVEEFLEKK